MRGLIVDNFAGGGGASTGIEMAIGRSVDIAINHDPDAIAMHTANHPNTLHYCESVFDVDPVQATAGRPVDLAWFSPDCTHHSKARGGKPREKSIRGLAWIVIRWALRKRPRVIPLENVEEFVSWGPLDDKGQPVKSRLGETFHGFKAMLTTGIAADHPALQECCKTLDLSIGERERLIKGLGYEVDHRDIKMGNHGLKTRRKRFFLIARCDGQPIVWPEETHNSSGTDGKRRWRQAAECIDFTDIGRSILGRKKPIARNTLRRLAHGFVRFVRDTPEPYIVRIGQTGFGGDGMSYSVREPITTVTTKAEHLLVSPVVIRNMGKSIGQSVVQPWPTNLTKSKDMLMASHLVHLRGTCKDGLRVDSLMPTITAGGKHVLLANYIIKYYGTNIGQPMQPPLQTVTVKQRFALAQTEINSVDDLTDDQRYNSWCLARMIEEHGPQLKERALLIPVPRPSLLELPGGFIVVDLFIRMIRARELFNSHDFPPDYVIDVDQYGNKVSEAVQVARVGNSVPPLIVKLLIECNLPELCTSKQEQAA